MKLEKNFASSLNLIPKLAMILFFLFYNYKMNEYRKKKENMRDVPTIR